MLVLFLRDLTYLQYPIVKFVEITRFGELKFQIWGFKRKFFKLIVFFILRGYETFVCSFSF